MILVIDNYDSFTYNLVQFLGELGAEIVVARNDKISLDEIRALEPQQIVISPGPARRMTVASPSRSLANWDRPRPSLAYASVTSASVRPAAAW